jgi:hypothetical protein
LATQVSEVAAKVKIGRFRHRRTQRTAPRLEGPRARPADRFDATQTALAGHRPPAPDEQPHAVRPDHWADDGADWLKRARGRWQAGDWAVLAALSQRPLHRHPDRARLVLLAAAGHFQQGDTDATRRCVGLALDWGCDRRLVGQVLLAGLHNTLGRAATLLDQPAQALSHFTASIVTGSPGSSVRAVTQLRGSEQLLQLGLGVDPRGYLLEPVADDMAAPTQQTPAPAHAGRSRAPLRRLLPLARVELAHCPRGLPTEAPAVAVDRACQFVAVAVSAGEWRLVQRNLASDTLVIRDLERLPGGTAALAVGPSGHLHLLTNTPDGGLLHRRSTQPGAVKQWSRAWALDDALCKDAAAPGGCGQLAAGAGLILLREESAASVRRAALLRLDPDGAGCTPLVGPDIAQPCGHGPLPVALAADAQGGHHLVWCLPPSQALSGRWQMQVGHAVSGDAGATWQVRPGPTLDLADPGQTAHLRMAMCGQVLQLLCGVADAKGSGPLWHLAHGAEGWRAALLVDRVAVHTADIAAEADGRALALWSDSAERTVWRVTRLRQPDPGGSHPRVSWQLDADPVWACLIARPPEPRGPDAITLLLRERAEPSHAPVETEDAPVTDTIALHDFALD